MSLPLADGFWSVRTINDVVGIGGLVLALGSIWLAWWLAKRDIEKRLRDSTEEARAAVLKLATSLLRSDLHEAIWSLREGFASCSTSMWSRAVLRVDDGMLRVVQVLASSGLEQNDRDLLRGFVEQLRPQLNALAEIVLPTSRRKHPLKADSQEMVRVLGLLVEALVGLESRLRIEALERFNERVDPENRNSGPGQSSPQPDQGRES